MSSPPINVTDIETFKPEMLTQSLRQEGEKILSEVKELAGKEGVEVRTRVEDGIPDEKIHVDDALSVLLE